MELVAATCLVARRILVPLRGMYNDNLETSPILMVAPMLVDGKDHTRLAVWSAARWPFEGRDSQTTFTHDAGINIETKRQG